MLHAFLVNGRFGDPALFVQMLHRREALLFDAGDLSTMSARDLLRVTHVFVTHMHMDHFIGFDALLRVHVGREKRIRVMGPSGIIDRVGHKLHGYDWDLVQRYKTDLVFEVMELGATRAECAASFAFKGGFERKPLPVPEDWNVAAGLAVKAALLEHHGPCIGYAISEPAHLNVWKNRLQERGLGTGKWLQQLKAAVLANFPDEHLIELSDGDVRPLGVLRDLVTVTRGQKIAYITDVADSPANRAAIQKLASSADLLFLEARFAAADIVEARERAHLTTRSAGEIARAACARRLEPFHFSPRYDGEEQRMLDEVRQAFTQPAPGVPAAK